MYDLFSGPALENTDAVSRRWALRGSGYVTYVVAAEVVHRGLGKLRRVSQLIFQKHESAGR